MMKKKSFLERLTGGIRMEEEESTDELSSSVTSKTINLSGRNLSNLSEINLNGEKESGWEEDSDAELTIDLYQTGTDVIVQTMVAGVQPDNLSITITRDSITIRGKREENQAVNAEDYFVQELYWGSFSRTISFPEEIDPEEAEAIERHGLLIIKLPKINKNKETKLKVKSI